MVEFYGISTLGDNLMPNPVYIYIYIYIYNHCFFKYNNAYNQQKFGLPMLSPLSGILAYFYLDFQESQLFKHILPYDIQYFRYIDDILIIYPKEHYVYSLYRTQTQPS